MPSIEAVLEKIKDAVYKRGVRTTKISTCYIVAVSQKNRYSIDACTVCCILAGVPEELCLLVLEVLRGIDRNDMPLQPHS